jgi:hypothetical protein
MKSGAHEHFMFKGTQQPTPNRSRHAPRKIWPYADPTIELRVPPSVLTVVTDLRTAHADAGRVLLVRLKRRLSL